MSQVPADIAGIGSTQQKLRVSPGFDPLKAVVGPEEYFVLSRIDGTQSLREVLLATGLPVDRAIAIVTRLRSIGALLLPGEVGTPPPAAPRTLAPSNPQPIRPRTLTPIKRSPAGTNPLAVAFSDALALSHDLTLPHPSAAELAALGETVDLDDTERRRILAMERIVDAGSDPHALLGLAPGAEQRDFKRAYFQLSKEIHPDRYYGKQLGSYAVRLARVFEAASRAHSKLTGTDRKHAGNQAQKPQNNDPQTPQAYAAELFERACHLEVAGDHLGAMKLFAAAVRVDAQLRYLRRAASCALAAQQPRSAVEYAKKAHTIAPNDPSSARLLAAAFLAAGKLGDAEEVLVMAMALKSENDVLTSELRNDLAEVRRLLAQ
ncbi:MAG: hypothetical protein ABI867_35365 [Kofleriaceae bacterium]